MQRGRKQYLTNLNFENWDWMKGRAEDDGKSVNQFLNDLIALSREQEGARVFSDETKTKE